MRKPLASAGGKRIDSRLSVGLASAAWRERRYLRRLAGWFFIENLSRYLTDTFGNGFSEANLQNFRRFYLTFPEFPTHCVGKLSWSNICLIMRLDDKDEREYYLREAAEQNSRLLGFGN